MRFSNIKIEVEEDVARKIPFNFEKNIKKFLKVVPSEYILHLGKICVTSLSLDKNQKQAYGLYYGKREGFDMPTIMICASNLFKGIPRIIFYTVPFIPNLFLADTLYHEIAHHYQRVTHGCRKEKWERSAEHYSREMTKRAFLSSGLFRVFNLFKFILIPLLKFCKRGKQNNKT